MRISRAITAVLLLYFCVSGDPIFVQYSSYITDTKGVARKDVVDKWLDFRLYDSQSGSNELWHCRIKGNAPNGFLNVRLGDQGTPLPISELGAAPELWLELKIDGEPAYTRQRIASVFFALSALQSRFADSAARSRSSVMADSALTIADNAVSNSKIGAGAVALGKISTSGALIGQVPMINENGLTWASPGDIKGVIATSGLAGGADTGEVSLSVNFAGTGSQNTVSRSDHNHDNAIYSKGYVDSLAARLAALEAKLRFVTCTGNDIFIDSANLNIRNGVGTTITTNGLGNVIVGYNETRTTGNDRTGSHNVVVGKQNNFSKYGGMVVGFNNTISGMYAFSNGLTNTAAGNYSSVSGGSGNQSNGSNSCVSGGSGNVADGVGSSVSGGKSNTATGNYSNVSGGLNRAAPTENNWRGGSLIEAQ